MKKILILLLLPLFLGIYSCDRYSHNFPTNTDNQQTPQQFFDEFKSVLSRLDTLNIDSVMTYYANNYLNNGRTKDDMKNFYLSLTDYNYSNIVINLMALENDNISFDITLYNNSDTLFTEQLDDVLIKTNDTYKFYGNQEGAQQNSNQKVMVLLFTGTLCQNCPYAESALEELKSEIGNKFSYAEFHHYIADPLEIPICSELYDYYQLSGVPQAIFQGQTIYGHFHNETVSMYKDAINHYAEMEAVAFLDSLTFTLSNDTINGKVKLTFTENNITNLKLLATVVEKESEILNYDQERCKQVVLAYSSTDISPINGFVEFTIDNLPAPLPDDSQIIVWIQTIEEIYNPETCKIYNVLEKDISK